MAGEAVRRLRAGVATVRVRTTAIAMVVVGVALIAAAFASVAVLRASLMDQVRTAATLRAVDVAGVLESGTPPASLAVNDEEDLAIQVLDHRGLVVASSPNVEGEPAMAEVAPGQSTQASGLPIGDGDTEYVVVAVTARAPAGRFTVLVTRSTETVSESTATVGGVLMVSLPLLLLIVGLTTWRVVGRALRPVEAMRAEVDEISAAELHRRVPDPPGRDEIARLAATMNRMLDRLERSQARQRRFVSDASHELRSPVSTIRQHAEVALAYPERTSTVELAETVLAEDLRVQRLVEDLLLLARADEHTLVVHRRPVDFDDLVFEEAARLRETTSLHIDTTAASAGRVMGDAAQLRRLLRNLADNAARHAAGRVTVSLGYDGDIVVLHVEDDGPGVPPAERERVFERFVRLDDARAREAGGSGLGLAIVAEITTAHGGTVAVGDSALGGARFELRLPGER